MARLTILINKVYGVRVKRAYHSTDKGLMPPFSLGDEMDDDYACGRYKPNYPVPAILGPVIIWEDAIDFTYAGLDEWGCYEFNFSIEAETRE